MIGNCWGTWLIMLGFMDLGWPRVCRRSTSVLLCSCHQWWRHSTTLHDSLFIVVSLDKEAHDSTFGILKNCHCWRFHGSGVVAALQIIGLIFTRGQFWPPGIVVVCVCVCINHLLVPTITRHLFKLGSPNLVQRSKTPWLGSLLFRGAIDLDLQGQI